MENECFGCGCTETNACTSKGENCHWLVLDNELGLGVCSSCPDQVEPFGIHQKEMATIGETSIPVIDEPDLTSNKIVLLEELQSECNEWEVLTLSKIEPQTPQCINPTNITFSSPIDTSVVLSCYEYGGLTVKCCLMELYGQETVGLKFQIGKEVINTHGVMFGKTKTAIPTDYEGNAIELSSKLPDDFEKWVRDLDLLVWEK